MNSLLGIDGDSPLVIPPIHNTAGIIHDDINGLYPIITHMENQYGTLNPVFLSSAWDNPIVRHHCMLDAV